MLFVLTSVVLFECQKHSSQTDTHKTFWVFSDFWTGGGAVMGVFVGPAEPMERNRQLYFVEQWPYQNSLWLSVSSDWRLNQNLVQQHTNTYHRITGPVLVAANSCPWNSGRPTKRFCSVQKSTRRRIINTFVNDMLRFALIRQSGGGDIVRLLAYLQTTSC